MLSLCIGWCISLCKAGQWHCARWHWASLCPWVGRVWPWALRRTIWGLLCALGSSVTRPPGQEGPVPAHPCFLSPFPGGSPWPGWRRQCGTWAWRFISSPSPALCPSPTRHVKDTYVPGWDRSPWEMPHLCPGGRAQMSCRHWGLGSFPPGLGVGAKGQMRPLRPVG